MFEIYRDTSGTGEFRAVYFTELDDHTREAEIARAMSGEHVFDGFLRAQSGYDGKAAVNSILDRLNSGEALAGDQIREQLLTYLE